LVSEFNLRGEFYQSDLEVAKTLATSEKTIRRARVKLVKMNLIEVKPGQLKHNRRFATRYLSVRYATMKKDVFFAQMPRHTFHAMLDRLRKSHLQAGDVVVYVCLFYWFWRNRAKYEDRDRFFITKKELQSLANLRDASTRIPRIYEAIIFPCEGHLFEYKKDYRLMTFRDWTWCAEPDDNEQNRQNAERYNQEIKDLVIREKQGRQLKVQQKIAKTSLLPFEFFKESYKKKHGRLPDCNSSIEQELHEIEKIHGYGAIYRAISWYFTADTVPNDSGAKSRTLHNFVRNIDNILKLSEKSVSGQIIVV